MSISLIINYSRSGGTILSKCLASLPSVVLLSEVNPCGYAVNSIQEQAYKWYKIVLKENEYINAVMELHRICQKKGWQLVIRDWTFLNFTPHEVNNFQPTQKISALEMLEKQVEVKKIAFVRNAIDIWISRWKPPLFFPYYKKYIEEIVDKEVKLFKYENFCKNPEKEFRNICYELGVAYHPSFNNYIHQDNVTGDNLTKHTSRGQKMKYIQELRRKQIAKKEIDFLHNNNDLFYSNKLVGYSNNYYDSLIEKNVSKFKVECQYYLKRMLRIQPKDQF